MRERTPGRTSEPPAPRRVRAFRPRTAELRLAALTWLDVRRALDTGRDAVVVPFGATEQHGSHLPLATDTILGDSLGVLLAERLHAVCAPTIPVGCSEHHMVRAGTLSLRPETLGLVARDIVDSLIRHGFRTIVLLPTHAGNADPLNEAARLIESPPGVRVATIGDVWALASALHERSNRATTVAEDIAHAGHIETSLILAIEPGVVLASSGSDRSENGARWPDSEQPGNTHRMLPRRRAMRRAGRGFVAAFIDECCRQLEVQGVRTCA